MRANAAPDPLGALQAAARPATGRQRADGAGPRLLVAGAGGPLGRAVLEQALAGGRYAGVSVLTCAPLQSGLRGLCVLPHDAAATTPIAAETAVVAFDRGRDFHGRDAAYYLPDPAELPSLARRLREGGARTLVVMEPVAPSLLPLALQHGLATLDEHAVVACGFERLLFVRPTQAAAAIALPGAPQRLARWMLSQLRYMIPAREQPVRADSVAAFVFEVLRQWPDAPAGTRVAAAPLVWQAAQAAGPEPVVRDWLGAQAVTA
jgi:hypothetical protein